MKIQLSQYPFKSFPSVHYRSRLEPFPPAQLLYIYKKKTCYIYIQNNKNMHFLKHKISH